MTTSTTLDCLFYIDTLSSTYFVMRGILLLFFIFIVMLGKSQPTSFSAEKFTKELIALQSYFHIPGLAICVQYDEEIIYENYLGYADLEQKIPVQATTRFPIASITKAFSAVLLMQLVEQHKLRLDDAVNNYLEKRILPETVKVKHLLSHTSEGQPGSFFNYSPRYALLTKVIEKVSGQSLAHLLQQRIIEPLDLKHTTPLTNQAVVDSLADLFALPYLYYGEVEKGHFDPGLSAASGLASTVQDLACFNLALDQQRLVKEETLQAMFSPTQTPSGQFLPYGYGFFSQPFLGEQIVWAFGQEDCFSSLFIKVPIKGLSMFILANNNLMNDPARLINGDITFSLFALTFLKHFVFDLPEMWSFEKVQTPTHINLNSLHTEGEWGPFYRQELLAYGLASSFLGQAFPEELVKSAAFTRLVLQHFPNITSYGNNSFLKTLISLSTSHSTNIFKKEIDQLGHHLLEQFPHDPYTNVYLGFQYAHLHQPEKAKRYFEQIINTPNASPFWYTIEAYDYLADYYKSAKPDLALAKKYYQKIVDIGWNINGKLDKAKRELKGL